MNQTEIINKKILLLEEEQLLKANQFKTEFDIALDKLQPMNILKQVLSSPETKTTVIDTSVGLASGILAKNLITRSSNGKLVGLVGSIVQMGVTKLVVSNPQLLRSIGKMFFRKKVSTNDGNSVQE